MSLREKLDAFRAQVESGTRIPISVVEKLHKSTEELIASGQAERAKKAGDGAPNFELEDTNGRTVNLTDLLVNANAGPLCHRAEQHDRLCRGEPRLHSPTGTDRTVARARPTRSANRWEA
jgi:hypothetical protein